MAFRGQLRRGESLLGTKEVLEGKQHKHRCDCLFQQFPSVAKHAAFLCSSAYRTLSFLTLPPNFYNIVMVNTFSLEGKALKLDSAADMDKHIAELKANNDVEEVIFVGNTLGVEACKALAQVLESKKKLKVSIVS